MTAPLLELRGISKSFSGLRVLDRVGFALEPGTVLGLLGENGAGKTTLMNLLFGLQRPDEGEIRVDGRVVAPGSPRAARDLGIGMVHQHFTLAPGLSVAENFALDEGGRALLWFSRRKAERRVRDLAAAIGFSIDPRATVGSLSVGDQQRAEILKALKDERVRLLILDEPTATLTPAEVEDLFGVVRRLRRAGPSVILISHKLREVRAIADRIVVLRAGRVVAEVTPAEASEAALARLMVGEREALDETAPAALGGSGVAPLAPAATGEGDGPLVELCGVEVLGAPGRPPLLAAVDLAVAAGEIAGVAGVEGNGQAELCEVLVGLRRPDRGAVRVLGRDESLTPGRALDRGIAYVPADRRRTGLALALRVDENLILRHFARGRFGRGPLLDRERIAAFAAERIERFDVRPPDPAALSGALSGGNQQRLVLGRELAFSPRIIVAHNPTRGLDVKATEFVHARLLEAARHGAAVVVVSSDLDEVLALSRRIYALFRGHLRAVETRDPVALGLSLGGAR